MPRVGPLPPPPGCHVWVFKWRAVLGRPRCPRRLRLSLLGVPLWPARNTACGMCKAHENPYPGTSGEIMERESVAIAEGHSRSSPKGTSQGGPEDLSPAKSRGNGTVGAPPPRDTGTATHL